MRRPALWILVGTLLFAMPACSADAIEGAFIFITNNWEDIADPTHRFDFQSADDGERQGTFEGTESVDNGAVEFPLVGSWARSRLVLTVQRSPTETATYTAILRVSALDELRLEGPGGPYTIRRVQ